MVKAVKQAMREIQEDERHQKIHGLISIKVARETPSGKHGMAKCGMCDLIIQTPPQLTVSHESVSDLQPSDSKPIDGHSEAQG